jgi:hypothetical protein
MWKAGVARAVVGVLAFSVTAVANARQTGIQELQFPAVWVPYSATKVLVTPGGEETVMTEYRSANGSLAVSIHPAGVRTNTIHNTITQLSYVRSPTPSHC